MKHGWSVYLRTFFFNNKSHTQFFNELGFREAVQIFYSPVIVDYPQLIIRKVNCQEKIIFFSSIESGIILTLFFSHKCGCGGTMMTISHVGVWYFFPEKLFNQKIGFFVIYDPEMMSDRVFSDKIIFRLFGTDNSIYDLIDLFYSRIGKENR